MSINRKRLSLTLLISMVGAILVLFTNAAPALDESKMRTGLIKLTPEELKQLEKRKLGRVFANQLAVERFNAEKSKQNKKSEMINFRGPKRERIELQSGEILAAESLLGSYASLDNLTAVPAQVDNSALPAFPQIGNQGNQGSCVAWATTYYVMSHQVCLSLGCDNKNLNQKVFSPRWTYNQINRGVDQGSSFGDAFNLMNLHGAALMSELPYNASDYRSWSTNPEHWKNAISSRMTPAISTQINTDAGIANVKQLLANGNILAIAVYVNSWVYGTVKAVEGQPSPFAGQHAVLYQGGTNGGHGMAVVGYDDGIWIDLNGNNINEAAEMGAFKVVNSWGTGYRNGGYIWVSYDAFKPTSGLAGFAPSGRIQLTQDGNAYHYNLLNQTRKIYANVTVSHAKRSEISLQFASSPSSSLTPQVYFTPFSLRNRGGTYAFDGSLTEMESTFVFDISSLAANSYDQYLYYLIASDNALDSPMTVRSFEIVDQAGGAVLYSAADVPKLVDATQVRLIAGDYTPDLQAPTAPANLTATLSTQKRGKRITTSVRLTWTASTDNVAVAKYEVYRNAVKIAETTSLNYSDASAPSGVSTYSVRAVDTSGNVSAQSNSVQISK